MEGYNSCLFAYGQTGSGKTYSMIGPQNEYGIETSIAADCGVVPRLCADLFQRMEHERSLDPTVTHRVECSFVEIYCEKVRDLLTPGSSTLRVRQHPSRGPYVEGLPSPCVGTAQAVMKLLTLGMKERATAETKMNEHSSRSHAILQLSVTRVMIVNEADAVITKTRSSKVNLVDLAGSERLTQSGATGDRLEEAKNINLSLHTLGRVIHTLAERGTCSGAGKSSIPAYRDSALTWLLSDSLGGNSKTMMIATIAASNNCYSQSLNTLRFAGLTQRVVNVAVVNEDSHFQKLISELREQIVRLTLKVETGRVHDEQVSNSRLQQENDELRSQNRQLESKLAQQETHAARELLHRVNGLETELATVKGEKLQLRTELTNAMATAKEELAKRRGDMLSLQASLVEKEREMQEWIGKYHEAARRIGSLSPAPPPISAAVAGSSTLPIDLSSPLPATSQASDPTTKLFFGDSRAKLEAKIQQTRGMLAEANTRMSELTVNLHTEESRRKHAEHARSDLAQRLSALTNEHEKLQNAMGVMQSDALQLRSQVEELQHAAQEAEARVVTSQESGGAARQALEEQLQTAQGQLAALRQLNTKLRHEAIIQAKEHEATISAQSSLRADVCELEQLLMEETETSERHFLELHGDSTYASLLRQHSRGLRTLLSGQASDPNAQLVIFSEELRSRSLVADQERAESIDAISSLIRSMPVFSEAEVLRQRLSLSQEVTAQLRAQQECGESSLVDACSKLQALHVQLNEALKQVDEVRAHETELVAALDQETANRENLVRNVCEARSAAALQEEEMCCLRQQMDVLEAAAQVSRDEARRLAEVDEEVQELRLQLATAEEQSAGLKAQLARAAQTLRSLNEGACESEVERSVLENSNATIATNYETVLHQLRQELRVALDENSSLRQQHQAIQANQQHRHREELRRLQDQIHSLQDDLQQQRYSTADAESKLELVQHQSQCDVAERELALQLQQREVLMLTRAVQQLRDDFDGVRSQVAHLYQNSTARGLGSPTPQRRHAKSRSLGGELTPISSGSNSRPGTGCRPSSSVVGTTPNFHHQGVEDGLLQEWSPGQFNRQIERARQEKDVTESQRMDAARLYEELLTHMDQRSRALQNIAHQLEVLGAGGDAAEHDELDDTEEQRGSCRNKLYQEAEEGDFSLSFSPNQ